MFGYPNPQFEQFTTDAFGAPCMVCLGNLLDQCHQFLRKPGPAALRARPEPPKELETSPMPA